MNGTSIIKRWNLKSALKIIHLPPSGGPHYTTDEAPNLVFYEYQMMLQKCLGVAETSENFPGTWSIELWAV